MRFSIEENTRLNCRVSCCTHRQSPLPFSAAVWEVRFLILTSNHTAYSHESINFQASNDLPSPKLQDLICQLTQHSHKAFLFLPPLLKSLRQAFQDSPVFSICAPGTRLACPIPTLPEISGTDPAWSAAAFACTAWHSEVCSARSLWEQPRGSWGGTVPAGDSSAWQRTATGGSAHLAPLTRAAQLPRRNPLGFPDTQNQEFLRLLTSVSTKCKTTPHLLTESINAALGLAPGFGTPETPSDFHGSSSDRHQGSAEGQAKISQF